VGRILLKIFFLLLNILKHYKFSPFLHLKQNICFFDSVTHKVMAEDHLVFLH
jgi:hypothetical protein